MFVEFSSIHDWMTLKYDSSRYKNKSLHQNVARLCIKKSVLQKIAIPMVVDELKACGIPHNDIISITKTYIQFALPFCVEHEQFVSKLVEFTNKVKVNMTSRFSFLLIENKDDNLQTLVIKLMENKDYRLQSSIYHASKWGFRATFEVLDKIDNVWSLRA